MLPSPVCTAGCRTASPRSQEACLETFLDRLKAGLPSVKSAAGRAALVRSLVDPIRDEGGGGGISTRGREAAARGGEGSEEGPGGQLKLPAGLTAGEYIESRIQAVCAELKAATAAAVGASYTACHSVRQRSRLKRRAVAGFLLQKLMK